MLCGADSSSEKNNPDGNLTVGESEKDLLVQIAGAQEGALGSAHQQK
jgi:hypothetical protein